MLVGHPVAAFQGQQGRNTPVVINALLGAVLPSSGPATPVSQPLADRVAFFPRATPASDGGWHVIFFTQRQGLTAAGDTLDSADAWYGHYSGSEWRDVVRIAPVDSATLSAASSHLVERNGELFFAYQIRILTWAGKPLVEKYGVVMLHRRGARWLSDTVVTESEVEYLDLIPKATGSGVDMVLKQGVYDRNAGRWIGTELLTQGFAAGWEPRQVLSSRAGAAVIPRLLSVGSDRVAIWYEVDSVGAGHWASLRSPVALPLDTGTMSPTGLIDFDAVTVGAHILWFGRKRDAPGTTYPMVWTDSQWQQLSTIPIRNDGFAPALGETSDSTAIVLTMHMGRNDTELPAGTEIQRLTLRCGR